MTADRPDDPLAAPVRQVATELLGQTGKGQGVEVAADLDDEEFSARVERGRYRPASQAEGSLANEVLRELNARPGHLWRKVHQGPASGSGEPDLDGCVHGRCVKIELKVKGGSRTAAPTSKQHRRLLQWQAAGAHVGVATSLQEVDDILARLDDPNYRYDGQVGAAPPAAPPRRRSDER